MLTKFEVEDSFKNYLMQEIPSELIKVRDGGRQKLSYISGSTVIDMLNYLTNYMWSWTVDSHWIQTSEPKFNPKYDSEPKPQGPVAHVLGTLTVYLKDDKGNTIEIKKSASGSKSIIGGQSEQESIFKAAGTDALKKAASLLGIGAQLYRDEEEQGYFTALNTKDPWDEPGVWEAHESEREYLRSIMEENEYSTEDMDAFVSDWSEGSIAEIAYLDPTQLTDFVKYLRAEQEKVAS